VDGRIPARQRLGRRGRVFAPNAHGWWEIFPQHEAKPATASAEPCRDAKHPLQTRKLPAELHGKCFNRLSYSHRVATCRLPRRCLRCQGFGHLARDCRWTRHVVASATTGGDRPWHPARGSNPSASQHAPRTGGAASSAARGGGGGRRSRRRRRRRRRQRGDAAATASTVATDRAVREGRDAPYMGPPRARSVVALTIQGHHARCTRRTRCWRRLQPRSQPPV